MQTDQAGAALDAVLARLNAALGNKDIDGVAGLFQTDCYWRDLVTFTWNIRTMEGKDQIRDMLKAQLAPPGHRTGGLPDGENASEADGITDSWINSRLTVARGYGHIRLKDGRIWTLLTTMSELKGHEEPLGHDRPDGRQAWADRNRKSWRKSARQEAAELGHSRQPYVRDRRRRAGRHRARRAAASAQCADHRDRAQRARRRQLAQALQIALPA
jgi:putative flavoprotein involved in K+ transport